jgi:hypothetical protein
MNTKTLFPFSTLLILVIAITACTPQAPTQVAGGGFQITAFHEAQRVEGKIEQSKTFDQCESGSPFRANIKFSDSSSQSSQRELVLSGGVGGELGLSQVAKVQLQGAIEQHFSSETSSGQGHEEGVDIEVPAHTKQEYIILWREFRREGSIDYTEGVEAKSVNYSYRVGLELVSSTGRDLDCPGQASTPEPVQPTNPPEPTAVPTEAVIPPPNDTPQDAELTPRQSWATNGMVLTLDSVALGLDNSWWHEFTFTLENRTGGEIFFNANDATVEMLDQYYTIRDEMHSYREFLPDRLGNNESARFVVGFNTLYEYDPLSTSEPYIYIRVLNLSRVQNALWKIEVPH